MKELLIVIIAVVALWAVLSFIGDILYDLWRNRRDGL